MKMGNSPSKTMLFHRHGTLPEGIVNYGDIVGVHQPELVQFWDGSLY